MPANDGRAVRRAFVLTIATALTAGMALTASPTVAQPLPAIEQFAVSTGDDFPDDAFRGERTALASDTLLLTDPDTGLSFRRLSNASGTDLLGDVHGDPAVPVLRGRDRINKIGVTGAGTITAPFAERSLSLSLADEGSSLTGPTLQLTSPSDAAEVNDGYTTLSDPVQFLEDGKTYVLSPDASVPLGGSDGRAAVTATPGELDSVNLPALGGLDPLAATQQWTTVRHGLSDDGLPQFQMINRDDGTCLSHSAAMPRSGYVGVALCDAADDDQLWEIQTSPSPWGETGYDLGLFNIGHSGWLAAYRSGDSAYPGLWREGTPSASVIVDSWQWREVQQPTPIPASVAFPAEDRADFPFDLAVGDVDGNVDVEGLPRDEAIVAYAVDGSLVISAVNYSAGRSASLVTTVTTSALVGTASAGGDYAPVAVNIADLDADRVGEIIVTYVDDSGAVNALLAGYAVGDDGAPRLAVIGEPIPLEFAAPTDAAYSADAAVWDFNGDGVQEIAWAGADASHGNVATLWTAGARLVDGVLSVEHETTTALSRSQKSSDGLGPNARVRVESGQFQAATANSGPRQIAVTWEDAEGSYVDVFAVTADGDTTQSIFPHAVETPQVVGSQGVSLAVGGFAAAGGGDNPAWGLAVSAVDGPSTGNAVTLVQPLGPGVAPAVSALSVAPGDGSGVAGTGYELTAWDRTGESLVLGEPVVFTVDQLVGMNLVGGQPPAHSDWLGGEFVNISRNQDFSLTMGDSSSLSYENGTSQESNQSFGLTTEVDMSATVKVGMRFLSAEGSAAIADKLSASWSSLGTSVSSANSSQTLSITQSTQDDDIVNAIVQDYRVYRYPLLSQDTWNRTDAAGTDCEAGCYGYWDVVVPGEPHPVKGSGKSFAFYQPTSQNGNALSYPQLVDGQVPLGEVGAYSYTDANGATQTVNEPLVNQQFSISSVTTDESLDLSDGSSSGTTETSSKGWTGNLDVTAGVSAEVKIPIVGDVETEASLQAGFNAAQSFVGTVTGKTSNTHSSTFGIHVPAVDGNRGYAFGAAYYYGTDGAPRVSYGVDLTSDHQSREWWTTEYGQRPDPALNLAYSTILTYNARGYLGLVEWNPLDTRQEIRGFTARMPLSDDPTTSGATYAQSPRPGDPVVFDVDVANYSLKPLSEPLTVDFYAMPVDENFLDATGEAVPIGTETVSGIDPQSRVTVSSPEWIAQGASEGGGQNWRIFVVLDGADRIQEVHEWAGTGDDACPASSVQNERQLTDPMTDEPETLACGQNNQGFGQISVVPATDTAPASTASNTDAAAANIADPANVTLIGAGVLTGDASTLRLTASSEVPQVTTDHATTVMLRADADRNYAGHQTVIVYEGPPENGDVVAVTRMLGVFENGNSTASFQYVPEEDGLHELHAVILGDAGAGSGLVVRVNAVAEDDGTGEPGPGDPGDGDPGDGGAGGSADGDGGGDLATTGQEAWPWVLVGFGALLLVALGVLVRRARSRTEG